MRNPLITTQQEAGQASVTAHHVYMICGTLAAQSICFNSTAYCRLEITMDKEIWKDTKEAIEEMRETQEQTVFHMMGVPIDITVRSTYRDGRATFRPRVKTSA